MHRLGFASTALLAFLAGCSGGDSHPTGTTCGGDAWNLAWAKSFGGDGIQDRGHTVAALDDGSVLVAGCFGDTVTFGKGEPNEKAFVSDGYDDIFVAKYRPDGSLAWARKAGGTGLWDQGNGVAALPDGSFYLVGSIGGSVTFGQGEPNETTVSCANSDMSIFVAKYQADGSLAWVRQSAGAPGAAQAFGVGVAPDGSAIVVGGFWEQIIFGQGEPSQTTMTQTGTNGVDSDIFVAKYAPDGSFQWARQAGGAEPDQANAVAVLGDGSVLVTGTAVTPAIFGKGEANQTTTSCGGTEDVFIAKYATDGTLQWVRCAGGLKDDGAYGIAALADGAFLITGRFRETATFGAGEPRQTVLRARDLDLDIFVARYRADGSLVWATSAGGPSQDDAFSIAALPDGSSFIAGAVSGEAIFGVAVFGKGEPKETTLPTSGGSAIYVASYHPDGTLAWARGMEPVVQTIWGAPGMAYGIATQPDCSLVATGILDTAVIWGKGEADQTTLQPSSGTRDVFVVRIDTSADGHTHTGWDATTGAGIDTAMETAHAFDGGNDAAIDGGL